MMLGGQRGGGVSAERMATTEHAALPTLPSRSPAVWYLPVVLDVLSAKDAATVVIMNYGYPRCGGRM